MNCVIFCVPFNFRMKKEVSKKDLQIDTNMVQYHSEM